MPISMTPSALISALLQAGVDIHELAEDQALEPLVYLIETAGADLGYRFEWNAFGPYSSSLAADLADITDEDLETPAPHRADAQQAADRVRRLLAEGQPAQLERPTWIRLLAAVDYLQREAGMDLVDGVRPPYLQRNFEDETIKLAAARVERLHRA